MNEIKELRKPAKRKGATRVIISSFKRNIYFIDLIDFYTSSISSISLPNKTNGFRKCWADRSPPDSTRIVDTSTSLYALMDIRNT